MGRSFMVFVVVLVLVFLAVGVWVRFAPSDPVRWHVRPVATQDRINQGSAVLRISHQSLLDLNKIALSTPRTRVLAGSVQDGMITYITRSAFWGFPDYITVAEQGDDLIVFARLRFGRSDFGVNEKRLKDWRGRLQAGQ
jgi:uncharacterized protein (DUF1499 family)